MDDPLLPEDSLEPSIKHAVFNGKRNKISIFYTLVTALFLLVGYFLFLSSPADFPSGKIFKIEQGSSLRSVSLKLKNENVIRSRTAFEAFVIIFGKERQVVASDYYFENKLPVYEVAGRISKGEHHLAPIAVTIREGLNSEEIADVLVSKLTYFDRVKFLEEAKPLEGSLFPDTYFFFPTATYKDVLRSVTDNFNKKINSILGDIVKTGHTKKEIITMASIIEREARGESDRGFISGILWKRIALRMPLQVDAAPDTYKTKGLPDKPIGNPGILALKAAIDPQNSLYLYYLHDKQGNIHYAKSFAEHRANIEKYLK